MPFFLGSGFLVAAAAAVVPIALHLLHRRRPQPIMFGTLRFLHDAIAQTRRSHRLTQGLTLLMRVLIILLLAAAFARPFLQKSGLIPAGHRTVLLVIDTSASMQTLEGGKNYFEHARAWVLSLLDGLQDGDRVALIAAGAMEPRVVFPPCLRQQGRTRRIAGAVMRLWGCAAGRDAAGCLQQGGGIAVKCGNPCI